MAAVKTVCLDKIHDLKILPLEEIELARQRLPQQLMRTPLLPLNLEVPGKAIYLKLENLQPVGSFKVRGACNAFLGLPSPGLDCNGVYTSSAGNFGVGLSWIAQRHGIPCKVIVPDTAALSKIAALKHLGAVVHVVPYEKWWRIMQDHGDCDTKGMFIHPTCDRRVIAGNGTIGLEIYDDLPTVDSVICPFGGGGLIAGIASALKTKNPGIKVYACEVNTAAPLACSLLSGKPSCLENHKKTFVDGMGGKSVFPDMWNMASNLLEDSILVSEREICEAVKCLLTRNHVLAEAAGAAPVAAALTDKIPDGTIVCVVSGGNIDLQKLMVILNDGIPD